MGRWEITPDMGWSSDTLSNETLKVKFTGASVGDTFILKYTDDEERCGTYNVTITGNCTPPGPTGCEITDKSIVATGGYGITIADLPVEGGQWTIEQDNDSKNWITNTGLTNNSITGNVASNGGEGTAERTAYFSATCTNFCGNCKQQQQLTFSVTQAGTSGPDSKHIRIKFLNNSDEDVYLTGKLILSVSRLKNQETYVSETSYKDSIQIDACIPGLTADCAASQTNSKRQWFRNNFKLDRNGGSVLHIYDKNNTFIGDMHYFDLDINNAKKYGSTSGFSIDNYYFTFDHDSSGGTRTRWPQTTAVMIYHALKDPAKLVVCNEDTGTLSYRREGPDDCRRCVENSTGIYYAQQFITDGNTTQIKGGSTYTITIPSNVTGHYAGWKNNRAADDSRILRNCGEPTGKTNGNIFYAEYPDNTCRKAIAVKGEDNKYKAKDGGSIDCL